MSIFLTMLFIGFALMISSLFVDNDHGFDHGDVDVTSAHEVSDGPSWLNLKIIAVFLVAFGAMGSIVRYYGYDIMTSSLLALANGLALAFCVYKILKLFYAQQASSHVSEAEVIGKTALVTVAIADFSVGEITLIVKGSQLSYVARSTVFTGEPIKEGSLVRINGLTGVVAIVSPLTSKTKQGGAE